MKLSKDIIHNIQSIIAQAREKAVSSVNHERVLMYWQIGKIIFEEEQQGKDRAGYGEFLIKSLANELQPQFGSSFTKRHLYWYVQFYRTFPIVNALRTQFSWSHYRLLIRVDNQDKRAFYIAETEKNLESAIISQLQDFLLELGNGFSFVARQKRLHIDRDEYFLDLVFYNRLLQCFVIIEIKTHKLTHQDLGQLQMYANYYDRKEKIENENPTIGILLCADKNETMVKISLPENNKTIVASKYQLYLPTEQQLIEELKREIEQIDKSQGE